MKASDIKAVVTGDDDSWMRIKVGPLPIGFGYSKFRYTPEGLVGEQVSWVLYLTCIQLVPFDKKFRLNL